MDMYGSQLADKFIGNLMNHNLIIDYFGTCELNFLTRDLFIVASKTPTSFIGKVNNVISQGGSFNTYFGDTAVPTMICNPSESVLKRLVLGS